jgi:hypothetical protein
VERKSDTSAASQTAEIPARLMSRRSADLTSGRLNTRSTLMPIAANLKQRLDETIEGKSTPPAG